MIYSLPKAKIKDRDKHLCQNPACIKYVPQDRVARHRHGKMYCSNECYRLAKSKKWREEHPEDKQMSNYKYLKDLKREGDIGKKKRKKGNKKKD